MDNGNGSNLRRLYPRALVVRAVSRQQLDWLRSPAVRAEWGERTSREYGAPAGFDPSRVADYLEQVVRRVESEADQEHPLLFCERCCGWRAHDYECDEQEGVALRPTFRHRFVCASCGARRFYGASVCSMGPVIKTNTEVC